VLENCVAGLLWKGWGKELAMSCNKMLAHKQTNADGRTDMNQPSAPPGSYANHARPASFAA